MHFIIACISLLFFIVVAAFKVIAPNKNKAQERLAKLKRRQQ